MAEELQALARLNGVSTEFWDWSGTRRSTPPETLLRVLEALGVPVTTTSTAADVRNAVTWTENQPWKHVVPECTVARGGQYREVAIHVPHGSAVHVWVELEDGRGQDCTQVDRWVEPRVVDGQLTGRATFCLPLDLPLGYHQLGASIDGGDPIYGFLIVVPARLEPEALVGNRRYWGVNAQAYSVRSRTSWGVGDAEDLADLTAICAGEGADFLLINPLHATAPVTPLEDSPYLPVSRTWLNVTYIRPEAIPEYASLPVDLREQIEADRIETVLAPSNRGGGLNRDASWVAKSAALELVFSVPRSIHRQAEFDAFIANGGESLERFATWCALVEDVGDVESVPPFGTCQADPERVSFFQWLQWIAAAQLGEPNRVAKRLGMEIGIMSDLAVGVHPQGAAVWGNPEEYAAGMTVGAPPDMYSQQGQNWSQPPWSPRALERMGYQPFIGVVRAALGLSSALRIDHVLGLFRLWWIPSGESPLNGTYVNYDHESMVGVLLLEAFRHRAMLIGEDLGTVEPWVRTYLSERGVLGTSVLWFEKDEHGDPLRPEEYRRDVLATVNTHDLPPTAGYMGGVHTEIRDRLGLLAEDAESVRSADAAEQSAMRERLREVGLLANDDGSARTQIEALHRYIAKTPSRLVAVALVDAVGEVQPQNMPGTSDEYPNWKVPLSDSSGRPIWLEELRGRDDLQSLFGLMREEMG